MPTARSSRPAALLVPLLIATLQGCATPPPPLVIEQLPPAPVPAELMQPPPDSQDYSQRVLDWLKKVDSELRALLPR